ncbi:M23 family metallopeptidase [Sporichthya polymorpha]|uniref:M23 family metallopeptidase n=1 Tax=Sporichthya polymorpha TaxID=35751 RepID=UPI0012EBC3D0|nr:M23 family metallopeptidase [Sporichthya polymorpha]
MPAATGSGLMSARRYSSVYNGGVIDSAGFFALRQRISQIEAGLRAVQSGMSGTAPAADAARSFAQVLDAALSAQPASSGSSATEPTAGLPSSSPAGADPWVSPLPGRVTSDFGMRTHPITGKYKLHTGTDVAGTAGAPIRAASSGVVVEAEWEAGNGNTVTIDHGDGVITRYAHTSQMLVEPGERVGAGDVIARVGSTGLATGPHLHFEVRRRGTALDPEVWLGARGTSL